MPSQKKDSKSAAKGTTSTPRSPKTSSSTQQHPRKAGISSPVRFVLAVLSSLALNSGLLALTSSIHLDELQSVSKPLNSCDLGGLLAWRAFEIGLAWVLGYDGGDVLAFTTLTQLPTYTLLSSFYNLRPTTILVAFISTLFSTAVPFSFFRRLPSVPDLSRAANRTILQDNTTAVYTTLAATSIYTITLYISYATWLPAHLVVHFENLPDVSMVHAGPAKLPLLFLSLLPAGWAAKHFLFVSSTGVLGGFGSGYEKQRSPGDQKRENFACAVCHKTWGALPVKMRVLIQRTITVSAISVLSTIIQLVGTVQGANVQGASVWGAVFAAATLAVGTMFGWIEAVDGV